MDRELFAGLSDATRLWVTVLERPMAESHCPDFEVSLREMLEAWRHKGQAYSADFVFLDRQILLIAEPLLAEAPSGCAIDGMLRKLSRILGDAQVRSVCDHEVVLRIEGRLEVHSRSELLPLFDSHRIGPETPVIDRSLHDLSQLRAGHLERPLAHTWIGRKHGLSPFAV